MSLLCSLFASYSCWWCKSSTRSRCCRWVTMIRPKIQAQDCLRDGFITAIAFQGDPVTSKRPRDKRLGIDHREEGPHPANQSLAIHNNNNHIPIVILRHPTICVAIHPTPVMDMEVEVVGNHQERLRVVDQEEDRKDKLGFRLFILLSRSSGRIRNPHHSIPLVHTTHGRNLAPHLHCTVQRSSISAFTTTVAQCPGNLAWGAPPSPMKEDWETNTQTSQV